MSAGRAGNQLIIVAYILGFFAMHAASLMERAAHDREAEVHLQNVAQLKKIAERPRSAGWLTITEGSQHIPLWFDKTGGDRGTPIPNPFTFSDTGTFDIHLRPVHARPDYRITLEMIK